MIIEDQDVRTVLRPERTGIGGETIRGEAAKRCYLGYEERKEGIVLVLGVIGGVFVMMDVVGCVMAWVVFSDSRGLVRSLFG